MAMMYRNCRFLLLLAIFFQSVIAISQETTIIDERHYSHTFAESRNYRVFLPPGYKNNQAKRYPVIYFFHGWSQRYFGDGGEEYAGFDKGNDNGGDNIANFVAENDVIIVKWDGYNRSIDEPYYKRPYNVTPVENHRQFGIYFPELVNHIDKNYRTIADRQHRAVSGLSMGGFMTFFIAAKYPHLVCGAGNFCGSPEFEIGPRTFPVEYKHLDMYKNFGNMNVRLHYGDKDFIRGYHDDMNRQWTQLMDNYTYKVFDAEHSTAGMGEMFASLMKTIQNPPALPSQWHHTDVYPQFSVWDYEVFTDRNQPGFTVLENVDARGFRCAVQEFVPDGELLSNVNVVVITAPVYEKEQEYTINKVDLRSGKAEQENVRSDDKGRLRLSFNGSLHEIGINKKSDKPNISITSFETTNAPWATAGKEIRLKIKLLNKGMSPANNASAIISATRNNISFAKKEVKIGNIAITKPQSVEDEFIFTVTDTAEVAKLRIDIKDGNKNKWTQYIRLNIKADVPAITDFVIADGKTFMVMNEGTGPAPVLLGHGNGDGIANPGESIVILVKDSDKYWRTDLVHADPYVDPYGLKERRSDNWSDFDHVGASAKYDVPVIADNCPNNHEVRVFAEYWKPKYPYHIIRQGVISFRVQGSDATQPLIKSLTVQGNNVVEARIHDGSGIKTAKATLIHEYDPAKKIELSLKNDGTDGDRYASDNVFSIKIPDQKFGTYKLIVEATDPHGNTGSRESNLIHVVH